MRGKFAWRPHGEYLEGSNIARFMRKNGFKIRQWQRLIKRSVEDPEWFWTRALEDLGVEWFEPFTQLYDAQEGMPWTKWFINGKLNIAHNCIDRHVSESYTGKIALIFEDDNGNRRNVTYERLQEEVSRLAGAMAEAGIRQGDAVAMCMPISPEAVTVMFACLKIGAVCMQIASRSSPEDVKEAIDRANAKMLFMNDGYLRGGKWIDCGATYTFLRENSKLERIVVCNRYTEDHPNYNWWLKVFMGDSYHKMLSLNEFVFHFYWSRGAKISKTVSLDAEHPALILFSSGTTGKSKAIVHTHAGALAQIVKEVGYAFDCRQNDIFYWFTNFGWMMAPWELIGVLFFGATVVLYEGTHIYPTPHRLFELIAKHRISIFGCTPTVLRHLAKSGEDFSRHDLSSLRILGSTGEPLDKETWQWYFQNFGQDRCPIMNISGGTELIGCFVSPLPLMPQKPGTVGGPGLGMAVDVVDESGQSVREVPGDLVCRAPFPSMTRGFLGEPERFIQTYFSRSLGLWNHGDRVFVDEDGFWFMLGRNDDVIISGGVKHDPAKIEAALIAYLGKPGIKEAAVIGAKDELRGERIVSFVVLDAKDNDLQFDLEKFFKALRAHVAKVYDPLGRPDEIYIVESLPKNRAAKIPRRLIKRVFEGQPPGDIGGIEDPKSLESLPRK